MTTITERLRNWRELTSLASKMTAEIVTAAIIAAAVTALTGGSHSPRPPASRSTVVERFIGNTGPSACGERAWPYLAPNCLRRLDNKPIGPVRIIAMNGSVGR